MDEIFVPEKHGTLRNLLIGTGLFVAAIFMGGFVFMYWQSAHEPSIQDINAMSSSQQSTQNYSKEGEQVVYLGHVVEGANAATFEVLSRFFAKDNVHAYYRGIIVEGIDVSSFTPLLTPWGDDTFYSKDKNSVYISSPQSGITKMLEGAGPATMKVLAHVIIPCMPEKEDCTDSFPFEQIYAKDANHVYGMFGNVIADADSPSFEIILAPDGSPSVYARDKDHIFVSEGVLKTADRNSFVVLNQTDAQDKNNKYFEGQIITSVNSSDISNETHVYLDYKGEASAYSQNEGKVSFQDRLIADADSPSFSVLCSGVSDLVGVARDRQHVYYKDRIIEGADPATFQVFYYPIDVDRPGCQDYAKDENHVYYFGATATIVSNSPSRFGQLSWNTNLWTDGQKIFDTWGNTLSADAPHFKRMQVSGWNFLYASDSVHIYTSSHQSLQLTPRTDIDAMSFEVLNDWYARDNNRIYYKAISDNGSGFITPLLNSDPSSFVVVSGQSNYDAQDKNHKYFQGNIVQ